MSGQYVQVCHISVRYQCSQGFMKGQVPCFGSGKETHQKTVEKSLLHKWSMRGHFWWSIFTGPTGCFETSSSGTMKTSVLSLKYQVKVSFQSCGRLARDSVFLVARSLELLILTIITLSQFQRHKNASLRYSWAQKQVELSAQKAPWKRFFGSNVINLRTPQSREDKSKTE